MYSIWKQRGVYKGVSMLLFFHLPILPYFGPFPGISKHPGLSAEKLQLDAIKKNLIIKENKGNGETH